MNITNTESLAIKKNKSQSISNENMKKAHSKQKYFLICESCFWCASSMIDYHYYNSIGISKCPVCNRSTVESIPLSDKEAYVFDYSPVRGVSLTFQ